MAAETISKSKADRIREALARAYEQLSPEGQATMERIIRERLEHIQKQEGKS